MATVTLQFIQYNNYFNKILKKPENPFFASSYEDYPEKAYITGVAFNENDGVTTSQVVNNDIDDVGDYLLVLDAGDNIISHWFVVEATRNRLGQCVVRLQRDLLVDYYEKIKTAPAFVERGMLSNDDPMIFNDEGLSFNQIKTSVKPLLDDTGMAWIVGYMAKESDVTDNQVTSEVTIASATPDYTYSSWSDAPQALQDLITGTSKFLYNSTIRMSVNNIGYVRSIDEANEAYYIDNIYCEFYGTNDYNSGYVLGSDFKLRADGTVATQKSTAHALRNLNIQRKGALMKASEAIETTQVGLFRAIKDNLSSIKSSLGLDDDDILTTINTYKDKIVSVGGTLYKLDLKEYTDTNTVDLSTSTLTTSLLNKFFSIKKPLRNDNDTIFPNTDWIDYVNQNGNSISTASSNFFALTVESSVTGLAANQLGQTAVVSFPEHANRQQTIDAQYDMFAIPLPLKNFGKNGTATVRTASTGHGTYVIDSEVSLSMAQKIAVTLGSKLYDIQVLPYCPFAYKLDSLLISMVIPPEGIECKHIKVNGVVKSFIYFCPKSEFETNLYFTKGLGRYLWGEYWDIPVSGDSKTQKSTMKYRLSSGNYAAMFDFTPDMNGGVRNFKAYCNYKPYKPFIKVNPLFSYLYGDESFRDANGLILSGDFSLTVMSDAWTNYLIQNKNFEAMFDRQIQTVERTNDVTLMNSTFGAIAGAMGGTATGAIAGGMKGGIYGAIAGAVVGGATSTVGGVVDLNNQAMLMQDSLDLQRQMHAYQIDNIKALPDTIQKVSSLNLIDKIVPILEVFECTDTEKQAFRNYIRYNGMSVGRIDMIQNFESNGGFIQGRFIRLEGLSEDYHLANAINTTFQAGFYFMEEE